MGTHPHLLGQTASVTASATTAATAQARLGHWTYILHRMYTISTYPTLYTTYVVEGAVEGSASTRYVPAPSIMSCRVVSCRVVFRHAAGQAGP
ncbi:hypothetical protein LX32DRAFT_251960 [Colletotrichum zoysiae]|uniref:Uncharacterized protein n=1 Tax=Colletotrichum zoysiae TaxID=1216348 RepID=A0AAD9H428_9PEZI|nr:hypothetical protein LX32DRAFT_251960 [Colletotrichum zoysiae]